MSAATDVRDDRRYTKDHEWAIEKPAAAGPEITVGITAFAVDQLGDITLVNLDVKAGDTVTAGKAFGTIESVKTLSDLFAPVSGKVVRVNAALEEKPELVNDDCWGEGWMIVIAPSAPATDLMDAAAYRTFVKESAH
jgi:glycine cleavage system H protein